MLTTNTIISSSDWANVVNLPGNVPYDTKVKPAVLEAQQHDLREVLGREFYAEIAKILQAGDVASTSPVLTTISQSAYDALVPYMKWPVIYFAHARYLQQAGYQHTRSGLVSKDTAWSSHAEQKALDRRISTERTKAANYVNDLIEFLLDNSNDYPTWAANAADLSDSGTTTSINFSSI